jgi:putative methyltransferase (TIGR04325 family)
MSPITLFTYARPDHTQRTVEALLRNPGVDEHELIVYSDAPRTPDKAQAVAAVRDYLQTIIGFRSVTIHHRPHNFGLAKSIIEGVTEVLSYYERIIVLEDDMVTSPHFLSYMNEALDRFADEERVISVHGYVYPVEQALPDAFFLRGADCWGWATWRRGWSLFNPDGQALLDELKRRNLIKSFDFNGAYGYSQMLESQIKGTNDSWAIRWYASAFLADKLTLYPGRSLVHNIGNDSSGTHCGTTTALDAELSERPIDLNGLKIGEDATSKQAIEDYFRSKNSRIKRMLSRVVRRDTLRTMSQLAKDWLPPVIDRRLRMLVQRGGVRFKGNYKTWEEAAALCTGYDAKSILDKVLESTLKVKRGEAAFERDSVLFDQIQYSWPVTAALMWAAARNNGNLHVLDFGGSLGSSYFENKQFIEAIPQVSWSVVEQPHYVKTGKEYISDGILKFYKSIDECSKENKINCILLSSVIQYLPDPFEVLQKLSDLNPDVVIVDKTIVNKFSTDTIHIQMVPENIYSAEYPCRSLAEEILIGHFVPTHRLLTKFNGICFPALASINSEFVGYIFEASNEKTS